MHRHGHHLRCAGSERGAFALPGTERRYERSLPFRFLHLALDLRVLVAEGRVQGSATLLIERTAAGATELELDAVDFDIRLIEVDAGRGFTKASFDYDDACLRVRLGARFRTGRVRIHYEASPRRGLYFLQPDAKVTDRPVQVWSQCQDEDARHWFPCHDKPHVKMPAEFHYTVPSGMQVLANGELVERVEIKPKGGKRAKTGAQWTRFHYRFPEPLTSYLVTLVVGQFDVITDRPAVLPSGREVPVQYWLPKGKREEGLRAFHRTPHMIELFSRRLGVEYPFSSYTQVVVSDFIFGGMENTTATTMYEHVLLDERAAIDIDSHELVAHELAHQWFGDWVTCRDWPEAWLNEGFATYFEHIDAEDRKGQDEYMFGVERDLDSYLSEAASRYQRAIVSREYSEPIDLFDRHLYEKGSLVLHLLRQELGEDAFWSGLQRYVAGRGGHTVTTADLQDALEKVSGRSLDRFFDEWVRRPGHPQLKVKVSWASKLLTVQVEQTQKTSNYELSLELQVQPRQGNLESHTLTFTERHSALTLPCAERPDYVAVDPNLRVVGELNIEAPAEMLRQQLHKGRSARVRRVAAKLLAKKHDFKSAVALHKALHNEEEHWTVRAACAKSCGKLHHEAAREALLGITKSSSAEVRAAVAEALGQFNDERAAAALKPLLKDKSYLVSAAATLALGRTRVEDAAPHLGRQLKQTSWADIVASAALEGLAELRAPEHAKLIAQYTAYGKPTRARRSAVLALAKLSKTDETRATLTDLLKDAHPHFRLSVVGALEELSDPRVRGILSRQLSRENDGRVVRRIREALQRLNTAQPYKEQLDQMLRLEKDLNELKARLVALEAHKHNAS